MKGYAVLLLVILVPLLAAAFDSVGVSSVCAAAAGVFFLVAPIILVVGSLVGLLSRRRA
jgi:uncharacterized membrane protein YtjA (UPF0391 family)